MHHLAILIVIASLIIVGQAEALIVKVNANYINWDGNATARINVLKILFVILQVGYVNKLLPLELVATQRTICFAQL